MPVTLFVETGWPACFVVIVLSAKPKQNDVVIANAINAVFFICGS